MKARTVSKIHLAERLTAYTFVLPMLIIFSIVVIYPTISGFFYSLTDWNALSVKINMVGFYNYKRVVTDPVFYIAVKNTLFLTVLIVVFQNIFGLLFAVLLNNPGQRGKNFFRTTFFIPSLLSAIVTCYTWLYITNVYVGTYGLLLNALHVKNLVNYDFFLKPLPALLVIAFTMVWQYSGYNMVIYLAGLQSMPLDIFDAADIDGATPIQKFFRITLPLIVPSITVNTLINVVGCLKIFDQVYIMTKGGPGNSTTSVGTWLYNSAIAGGQLGYGTAISTVLFLGVLVIAFIQVTLLRSKEVEL